MAKRRRSPAIVQDEDTSDLDLFSGRSENSPEKPIQRNAANARERARMRVLSKAFCRLKTSLPWVPPDTKLSKLDTLRLAATYIAHLRKVLREDINDDNLPAMASSPRDSSAHPANLTWPFTINSRTTYSEYSSTSSIHGNSRNVAEYSHEGVLDYRNLMPCEYLAMNQSNCQRKDAIEHYLQ